MFIFINLKGRATERCLPTTGPLPKVGPQRLQPPPPASLGLSGRWVGNGAVETPSSAPLWDVLSCAAVPAVSQPAVLGLELNSTFLSPSTEPTRTVARRAKSVDELYSSRPGSGLHLLVAPFNAVSSRIPRLVGLVGKWLGRDCAEEGGTEKSQRW